MKITVVFFLLFYSALALAQDSVKNVIAVRINNPPVIDGKLDDQCWTGIVPATDFRQLHPFNGKTASFPSEVKISAPARPDSSKNAFP